MATRQSTVKWFDAKKGYGFIDHPDGEDDVFVHYSQIDTDADFKTLRTGQTVAFELSDGPKGPHAVNVVPEEESVSSSPQMDSDTKRQAEPSEASRSTRGAEAMD